VRVVGTSIYFDTSTNGTDWTNRITTTDSSISSGSAGFSCLNGAVDLGAPAVRISPSARSYYAVWISTADEEGWITHNFSLYKYVDGTKTDLGTPWLAYEGETPPDYGTSDDWAGGDL